MKHLKDACPTFVLSFLPSLLEAATAHGYALAVHGSLSRDFDFIAVPWAESASDPHELVSALANACGGIPSPKRPTRKPHGRLAWSILLGWGPYLDVSVMPRDHGAPTDTWVGAHDEKSDGA
jgi:hypothetical protein